MFVKYSYRTYHCSLVQTHIFGMNTLIDDLAVVAQRSTIMDDHVRLGRQYEIAVLQHTRVKRDGLSVVSIRSQKKKKGQAKDDMDKTLDWEATGIWNVRPAYGRTP